MLSATSQIKNIPAQNVKGQNHTSLIVDAIMIEEIKSDALEQMGFTPFRKKHIIIQARQILRPFMVDTIEGMMKGKANDYLVIGIHKETYPIDKEIFEKSYEYFCIPCNGWRDVKHLNENHPASFNPQ